MVEQPAVNRLVVGSSPTCRAHDLALLWESEVFCWGCGTIIRFFQPTLMHDSMELRATIRAGAARGTAALWPAVDRVARLLGRAVLDVCNVVEGVGDRRVVAGAAV